MWKLNRYSQWRGSCRSHDASSLCETPLTIGEYLLQAPPAFETPLA
jgi:hypothetical protein